MVSKHDIDNFIEHIPPLPEVLKNCIDALQNGDIPKAAHYAKEDAALNYYLIQTVNRASFGLTTRVEELQQIFSIFGLDASKQLLHAYLMSILAPKKWKIFNINNVEFNELQSSVMSDWNKILTALSMPDYYKSSSVLLTSSVLVCEKLFETKEKDVLLIKQTSPVSYNKILKTLSGHSLIDVAITIGQKWNLQTEAIEVVRNTEVPNSAIGSKEMQKLSSFLHLLLFYHLSRPRFVQAKLNDFIELNSNKTANITDEFMKIIGYNP